MIFVDTSAWFASAVDEDINHLAASQWLNDNGEALVTSDYVVDETLTLLRARSQPVAALTLGRQFFSGNHRNGSLSGRGGVAGGVARLETFSGKAWSFTDCTSKVLMKELRIERAFAFDQHFRQFDGVTSCHRSIAWHPCDLPSGWGPAS